VYRLIRINNFRKVSTPLIPQPEMYHTEIAISRIFYTIGENSYNITAQKRLRGRCFKMAWVGLQESEK
jgi:hypothetical protein